MDTFDSKDEFYRIIKRSNPPWFICENGEISSALFKNKDEIGNPGISVDCQDGRPREEAIAFMRSQFSPRLKAAVVLTYRDIRDVSGVVFRSPSRTNPHHAEIFKNETKEHISNLQALQLAGRCELCYFDEDVQWTSQ